MDGHEPSMFVIEEIEHVLEVANFLSGEVHVNGTRETNAGHIAFLQRMML